MPDDAPRPAPKAGERNEVLLATILPGAIPALVREFRGAPQGVAATQTDPEPADVSSALAQSISWAAHAKIGDEYAGPGIESGQTLADVLKADAPLDIIVYDDFSWWFPDGAEVPAEIAPMVERASDTVLPTARLHPKSGIGAPWWVDAGDRAHLRWVRPESEDELMNALARLHAAGRLTLGEGSRFAGSFRTHGLLVPVFDLDNEMHHEEWYEGLDRFDTWLTEALGEPGDLTIEERSSRDGLRTRQVTIR